MLYLFGQNFRAALVCVFLCTGLALQSAHASVLWTLHNFKFSDGGSVTGSFVWDEVNNRATSWSFVTSGGFAMPGRNYSSVTGNLLVGSYFPYDGFHLGTQELNFLDFYELQFNANSVSMSEFRLDVGGLLDRLDTPVGALLPSTKNPFASGYGGFLECGGCSPYRMGTEGAYLSGQFQTVPEPGALALSLTALAGLAIAARLRRAA